MMTKAMKQTVVRTVVDLLKVQNEEADRMETLDNFDRVFGVNIPDWEQMFLEALGKDGDAEAAVRSVEAFHAKNHVYGEDGSLKYERFRFGNSHHVLTVTYDASAPDGKEFKIEAEPDIDSMDPDELQAYYDELEEALSDLDSEEPEDEDSEDHEAWESERSDLEGLMDEVEDRLSGSSGE